MSGEAETGGGERMPPDGRAYDEQKRRVAERNNEARKRGRQVRAADDKARARQRRELEERGDIYR